VEAMSGINDSAKKIADIIGVIDEIAFQTNLLALNAAVEAARAGEQGRGFAVVASEVRSLAGRSATAAKEIKTLIEDSVRKVEDGSGLVTRSGRTLGEIVTSVKKVSDIVAEIAAASREQSSGIEQVNRAVVQMDELTQQNAALVEQATAASQSMSGQVRELNDTLARYDTGAARIAAAQQQSATPPTPGARNANPPAQRKARPESRRAAGGEWIEV
ncbi:MAG: methyl-accepting chemotaxis protein, partial [Steroidobacteraceae bacterium]